jgi:hypothetical protein
MNPEPSTRDLLEAIIDFSTKVDERFTRIDERFTRIESQMVTKEYLDDKLINLKGDLTVLMRKEDHKLVALTKLLATKKIITESDAKSILSLEPFPQSA